MTDDAAQLGRFAQLTYTSFDPGDGNGGWQVKDRTGGLDDAEEAYLLRHVTTQAQTFGAMPQFPGPDEIAGRSRTLVYRVTATGPSAYWHSIPAGHDAAGRPGNVFVHALVDRHPRDPLPPLRPVDLWRSPGWLTPFGGQEVHEAALPAAVPAAGQAVDRAGVVEFLLDPSAFRLPVLAVLLDAVHAGLDGTAGRGRRPVVLLVDDADEAALWVGAVSHLTSPGTARRLGFSIGERTPSLSAGADLTGGLDAVLRGEGTTTGVLEAVVVDAAEPPALGELDAAPHVTPAGSAVPVTEWSVLAGEVLQDPEEAAALLESAEALAVRLGDYDLSPALPLALTVATTPGAWGDAGREAAQVLHRSAPPRLLEDPDLLAAVRGLLDDTMGATAATAWDELRPSLSLHPASSLLGVALALYAERVLRDEEWLTRQGGVPPEGPLPLADVERPRLVRQLAAVLQHRDTLGQDRERAESHSVDDALMALRIVDLAVRAGLLADTDPSLRGQADVLVQRVVLPVLLDPRSGEPLVRRTGPLADATLSTLIRPLTSLELPSLGLDRGAPGHRLPHDVLDWLFPSPPTFPSPVDLAVSGEAPDQLLLERAVSLLPRGRARGGRQGDQGRQGSWEVLPPAGQDVRPFALWGLLLGAQPDDRHEGDWEDRQERDERDWDDADVDACFSGPPWDPHALRLTVERFGRRVRADHLLPTVVAAPRSGDLEFLCARLLSAPGDGVRSGGPQAGADARLLRAAAGLRRLSSARWWTGFRATHQAQQLLDDYATVSRRRPDLSLDQDVQVSVVAAFALRCIVAPFYTEVPDDDTADRWLRDPQRLTAAAERVAEAVGRQPSLEDRLAALAVATDAAAPPNDLREADAVAALATVSAGPRPFFQEAFAIRASRAPVEREVLLAHVTSALQRLLLLRGRDSGLDALERFAKSWCKENSATSGGGLHGAISRLRRS